MNEDRHIATRRRYPWHLAVITGAASGIGRCFAERLAADGCRLLLIDRNDCDLSYPGVNITSLRIDLTEPDAADRIMAHLDEHSLHPDLLINNAGIFDFKAVSDLTTERINLYIDLHIRAVTHLSRQMAIRMAAHGGGSILNMSSMSCWMPMPGIALYSATKAYIRVLSRALNVEMRQSGVTVTVACPGGIATDLFGLPRNLQRLGVRVGALTTPEKFVRNALKRCARRKAQYINGVLNRLAIPSVAMLPSRARLLIKTRLLDRQTKSDTTS